MKRFLTIIMLLFMLLLTGCDNKTDSQKKEYMFVVIQKSNPPSHPYEIVYHKDTKVMYAISDGGSSYGVFTVLVNPDGTPMIYEEESEE